jgi:hypothetical protein
VAEGGEDLAVGQTSAELRLSVAAVALHCPVVQWALRTALVVCDSKLAELARSVPHQLNEMQRLVLAGRNHDTLEKLHQILVLVVGSVNRVSLC